MGFSDWIVLGRWIVSVFLWWRRSKVDGFRRGRLGERLGVGGNGEFGEGLLDSCFLLVGVQVDGGCLHLGQDVLYHLFGYGKAVLWTEALEVSGHLAALAVFCDEGGDDVLVEGGGGVGGAGLAPACLLALHVW